MIHQPDSPPRQPLPLDLTPLRAAGWTVQSVTGNYAVAWRNNAEVVFVWRDAAWHRLTERSAPPAAWAA